MPPTWCRAAWPVAVRSATFFDIVRMPGRRAMLLPAQYAWFEPVLVATIVVFIIDLIGNSIGFGNRFLSALMSAIVFCPRVRNPCLFRLRQRVDVSDDDAQRKCPCSNAKVGQQEMLAFWGSLPPESCCRIPGTCMLLAVRAKTAFRPRGGLPVLAGGPAALYARALPSVRQAFSQCLPNRSDPLRVCRMASMCAAGRRTVCDRQGRDGVRRHHDHELGYRRPCHATSLSIGCGERKARRA